MLLQEFNENDVTDLFARNEKDPMTFALEIELEYNPEFLDFSTLYQVREKIFDSHEYFDIGDNSINPEQNEETFLKIFKKSIIVYNFYLTQNFDITIKKEDLDNFWSFYKNIKELANSDKFIQFCKKNIKTSSRFRKALIGATIISDNTLIAMNEVGIKSLVLQNLHFIFLHEYISGNNYFGFFSNPVEIVKKLAEDGQIEFIEKKTINQATSPDFKNRAELARTIAFPELFSKYKLLVEEDMSLNCGIEIKQKTYLKGLQTYISFVNDFYSEFISQDLFVFNVKTGLHVNIGYAPEKQTQFNFCKGFFFLNEVRKLDPNKPGLAYLQNPARVHNNYTQPWKLKVIDNFKNIIKTKAYKNEAAIITDISSLENEFNDIIKKKVNHYYGFNIENYLDGKNYIEFRYLGDDVKETDLILSSLYYAYIIAIISDKDYKKDKYTKKFLNFVKRCAFEA
jgi:hypothetical protein